MTTEPAARYRLRPAEEIEAVQWTGTNVDALRAFCGPDFDTIDPEDRAEDPDQDAQLLSDASHWVGMKPGDWVLRHVDHFTATSDEAFRAVWEPAVPVPPPTDQTALRDRIAEALYESCTTEAEAIGSMTEAVLAVLPEPTDQTAEDHRLALSIALNLGTSAPWDAIHDRVTELGLPPLDQDPVARRLGLLAAYRATVLREAADRLADEIMRGARFNHEDARQPGLAEAVELLRRLAAEAQPEDSP
jgi:hypothetical protein